MARDFELQKLQLEGDSNLSTTSGFTTSGKGDARNFPGRICRGNDHLMAIGPCQSVSSSALFVLMKNRIGVVILVLVSVILAIAVFSIKKDAAKRQEEDAGKINSLSNQLVTVNGKLHLTNTSSRPVRDLLSKMETILADACF